MTHEVRQMSRYVWEMLERATTTRTAFTAMQLATVDATSTPKSRTVILRDVDESSRGVRFITDTLSQKVGEIEQNPRVAFSGYDPDMLQQLRLEGTARVIRDDDVRRAFWNGLNPHSHVLYRSSRAPGSPLSHPDVDDSENPKGGDADAERVPVRFSLIEVRIHAADWLDLSTSPHRRFQVNWDEDSLSGTWVVP